MSYAINLTMGNPPEVSARPEPIDDARAAAWFDVALSAFESAEGVAGRFERSYTIGPYHVLFRFAGPALIGPMTTAFEHLATPPPHARPDVTVRLFDGATGGPLPTAPWGPSAYGPRGEIAGFNVGRIRTVYEAGDHTFRMANLARRCGLFWIRDAALVPYYERSAPVRTLLHWLFGEHGQFVHAAAVGDSRGVALLPGKGGSGKSTSALACIGSDLRYLGDDYVLLVPGPSGTVVHGVFSTAKLHAKQIEQFPALQRCVDNATQLTTEKGLLFLARDFPEALSRSLPLRVILLPKVTGRVATRVVPATPTAALAALAPTTVFQLPGDGRRTFDALTAVVRDTPSYWLELGTELRQIPEAIARVLQR